MLNLRLFVCEWIMWAVAYVHVLPLHISLIAENVYAVNSGQTAPLHSLIGLLNLINGLKGVFSALSATAVVTVREQYMLNRTSCCRRSSGRLTDALTAEMARNQVWYAGC